MSFVDNTGDTTAEAPGPRRARRRLAVLTIATVFALIAALVVLAISAEGREVSRASSNDGGAWLVNRELAVVGHKNLAAGELSASLRVIDSPAADVFQANDVVVVHDASTNQLVEVDQRSFGEDLAPTQLPENTSVLAVDGAVLVLRSEPLALWYVDSTALPTLSALDGMAPIYSASGSGQVAATPSGSIAVFDHAAGELQWFQGANPSGAAIPVEVADADGDLTIVGGNAVLLSAAGDLAMVGPDNVATEIVWADSTSGVSPLMRLQQATDLGDLAEPQVVGVTAQGEMIEVRATETGTSVVQRGAISGNVPLAPIVHEGCVHAVTTEPPVYGVVCDAERQVFRALDGASQELRLRLVNGTVWVNDLADGGTWVTDDELVVQKLDDWSLVTESQSNGASSEDDGGDEDSTAGDDIIVEDPDAVGDVQNSDDYDPTEVNVPPVALDDEARTRVERAVVVPVLENDSDANNDILIVVDAELVGGEARVSVTPSDEQVQIVPAPGFTGLIDVVYSISDGESDPVSASIRVDVLPNDGINSAPVPTTDVVATAPGHSTTIDLLHNDIDAEGDPIALVSVESESGTLRWDPAGQVTYTPDTTTEAGWLDLPYVVTDDRGAEADGLLRVEIRDRGANQEPDARNDHGSTIVGRPVVLQLLTNDTDPDGDPLIVGSRPVLLEPEGAIVQVSTTPDGEFVFAADQPGTYIFSYTVTDSAIGGSESDTARIRIDVDSNTDNEPPVAVRDDIVIPIGATRTVYALDNDGDATGDVVAIVDWDSAEGLNIVELDEGNGVIGFQITALPGGPARPSFNYWISDGVNDPVNAPIVVAVVDQVPRNQPPFAVDDVIEARVGSTINRLPVLRNDFDPEGGQLDIVRVGEHEGSTIAISDNRQWLTIDIPETAVASFSVPYDIQDQAGNRAAAIVQVQLLRPDAPNRPPNARTDKSRIETGTTASVDVLHNDSDPDSDLVALEGIVQQPAHGVARVGADGIITYRPDDSFTGTDHIRYSIVDELGDRDTGDVFIGVMPRRDANRPPIANDDSYELFGRPTTTPLNVKNNDIDPDGDQIDVIALTQPVIGRTAIDPLGQVIFFPPEELSEPAEAVFTYTIQDSAGNQDRATVTVTMGAFEALEVLDTPPENELPDAAAEPTPVAEPGSEPEPTPDPTPTPPPPPENEPPVAINDDRGPVLFGVQVVVAVLENDFDPDGPQSDLSIVEVGPGATLEGENVIMVAGEETATVSYTIEDAFGARASADVTVFVAENQAPTVEPFETATPFETQIVLELAGQASDLDGDPLFFACCDSVRGGSVRDITADEGVLTVTFVPNDRFIGDAGFNYSVDDQQGNQVAGSVSIDVRAPGNRPPETIEDIVRIPQGTTRRVDLSALASDPDDDDLTFAVVDPPGAGIDVVIAGSEAVISVATTVPAGDGPVLVWEVSDGLEQTEGRLEIEVTSADNRPPLVSNETIQVAAGESSVVNLADLTTEPDFDDPTSWSLAGDPTAPLTVQLIGTQVQISAPITAADETVSFGYTATDSRGAAATGTITVEVIEPTAPLPVAVNDTATTLPGESVTVPVLANDIDPLNVELTLVSVTTQVGTATISGKNVVFEPGTELGVVVITYTLSDDANRTASGTLTVEILGAPDKPAPPDVTPGNEEVLIEWDTPNQNGSDLVSYIVTRTSGGITETETTPVQNSFTWTNIDNGIESTFTVTAVNGVGPSDPSDPSDVVAPNLLPEVPGPPQVTFGNELLNVTWQPPVDNGGTPVLQYQLEIGGALSEVKDVGNTLSFPWPDLQNGEEYNFRVSAGNAAGFSVFSALSPSEHPETTPGPPTIGTVERGTQSGSLVIEWLAPTDDGGGDVDNYRIIPSIGEPVETGSKDTSYSWLNLENGVGITFQVEAHNRAGWGPVASGSSVEAIPCGVPDVVTWQSAVRLDKGARLVFDEPEDNGCGISGYIVAAKDSGGNTLFSEETGFTTYDFPGLTNGEQYEFEVRAINIFGTGDASVLSQPVIPAGPPICSSSVGANANATGVGQLTFTWGEAIGNGRVVDYYEVLINGNSQNQPDASEVAVLSGLVNDTEYSLEVFAHNEVGRSQSCGTASARTWAKPTPMVPTSFYDPITQTLEWSIGGGASPDTPITSWTFTVVGTCVNDVDAPPASQCVSSSGEVVAGPFAHVAGGSVPVPLIVSDVIDIEGEYWASAEVCNAVGCWESVNDFFHGIIAPPGPPDQLAPPGGGEWFMRNQRCHCATDVGRESWLIVGVDGIPDSNGSPILGFVWEFERSYQDTGEIIYQRDGEMYIPTPTGYWKGDTVPIPEQYSVHPNSLYNGRVVEDRARIAAYNALGQATWSEWDSGSPSPSTPAIYIESATEQTCASASDPPEPDDPRCFTFAGFMLHFGNNDTYLPEILADDASLPVPCDNTISTDFNGGGTFSVSCEVESTSTSIRLYFDGYVSGVGQWHPGPNWHPLPS